MGKYTTNLRLRPKRHTFGDTETSTTVHPSKLISLSRRLFVSQGNQGVERRSSMRRQQTGEDANSGCKQRHTYRERGSHDEEGIAYRKIPKLHIPPNALIQDQPSAPTKNQADDAAG